MDKDIFNKKNFKNDLIIIILILGLCLLSLLIIHLVRLNDNEKIYAEIWHKNKLIEIIDLNNLDSEETKEYIFDDEKIVISYMNRAIRVISSTCPEKTCEETGYTSSPLKPIICLHLNFKVIIKDTNNNYDVVVG